MNNTEILKFDGDYELDEATKKKISTNKEQRLKTIKRHVTTVNFYNETKKGVFKNFVELEKERHARAKAAKATNYITKMSH